MVGFTRATRRHSVTELGELVERFESTTTEVIAAGRGRIVRTVGDVYGEPVTIASRLTTHEAPADDDRFAVRPLRPVAVRGYRHLHPWVLTRA